MQPLRSAKQSSPEYAVQKKTNHHWSVLGHNSTTICHTNTTLNSNQQTLSCPYFSSWIELWVGVVIFPSSHVGITLLLLYQFYILFWIPCICFNQKDLRNAWALAQQVHYVPLAISQRHVVLPVPFQPSCQLPCCPICCFHKKLCPLWLSRWNKLQINIFCQAEQM